jgi:hypothetical protein
VRRLALTLMAREREGSSEKGGLDPGAIAIGAIFLKRRSSIGGVRGSEVQFTTQPETRGEAQKSQQS